MLSLPNQRSSITSVIIPAATAYYGILRAEGGVEIMTFALLECMEPSGVLLLFSLEAFDAVDWITYPEDGTMGIFLRY